MLEISIVVPMYNEEGNVERLHRTILAACQAGDIKPEIIFVDDGSTDQTFQVAKSLQPLTLISFRRNFGQTAAMDAGIKAASHDIIVTMDGDNQNDPNDIPKLVRMLVEGEFDCVSGWRKNRKDPFMKRFISKGARLLRDLLIHDEIHDSGCSLKAYRKECFEGLTLFGEMHRFIPALLKIKGFKIGEMVVNHHPRTSGTTKYNWRRTFKGFLDMLSVWFWNKYAVRPLHLLGGLGLVALSAATIVSVIGIVFYLQDIVLFRNILPVVAVFLFLTGIQLILGGLMADIMSKSYYLTTSDRHYSIRTIQRN